MKICEYCKKEFEPNRNSHKYCCVECRNAAAKERYDLYYDVVKERKKPFWKRMLDKDNNRICRVEYYGKEIEIKGRKFFKESRSEYAHLTDAITGMHSGTIAFVEDNIAKLEEAEKKVEIPLEELPIATYDEHTRTFIYEKTEKGGA